MAGSESPKTLALSLLQKALNCGLRGKNRQAVQDCITILEDDGKSDLKDLSYRNLKPGKILRDPNRPGFMMRATKRSKIWIYRYSWENRQPEMRLGLYPEMNLQEAREAWQAARNYRLRGINPETAGQDDGADLTVREMCDKYMQLARQRKRSWKEDQRQIEFDILPSWGDRPVSSITPGDAENLLLRAYDRGSPRSAEKLLTLGRFLFNVALALGRGKNWHLTEGRLKAKPWVNMDANPFASITLPDRVHRSACLDEKGLRLFLQGLSKTDLSSDTRDALLLQLQTCARIGEVASMTWGEVDLESGVWTLPAHRAKNGQEHRVMVSRQSLALLESRKVLSTKEWVFTSPRTGGPLRTDVIGKGIARNRKVLGVPKDFTSHSLRHSVITGLASLGCGRDVRDRISNHVADISSDMDARYNRFSHDKEARHWLQVWADRLQALCGPECAQAKLDQDQCRATEAQM